MNIGKIYQQETGLNTYHGVQSDDSDSYVEWLEDKLRNHIPIIEEFKSMCNNRVMPTEQDLLEMVNKINKLK